MAARISAGCWFSSVLLLVALANMGRLVFAKEPIDVNVLVLNFDPAVPDYGEQRIHNVLGFNDPVLLSSEFAQAIAQTSSGLVNYHVAEWRDVDEIPRKIDGFAYTASQYVQTWQNGGPWHDPDLADYVAVLNSQGVPALVNSGVIDEVWMFGGPYFGFWESAMAGPRSFYINGGVYDQVTTNHPFVVMGFNYERSVAEMLHSLGHWAESSLSRVFGGWNVSNPQTLWDQYTANYGQTEHGPYGIGSIHYPANGAADYDYSSSRVVESTAPDWLNYPNFQGVTAKVSSADWGGTQLGYMSYWFDHLPRADGFDSSSLRSNNWWQYIYNFDAYDDTGWPKGAPRPGPEGHFYLFVDASGIGWQDALAQAAALHFEGYQGHLVTITSQEEMDYVVALLQGRESWIAGSDAADEGVWRWAAGPELGQTFFVDGEPIGYNGFAIGEPNGGTSENVLHMLGGQWWNDVSATYPNNSGFVVEFSVLPGDYNFDGVVDASDYVVWRKTDGTEGGYDTWRSHFGQTMVSVVGANAGVPEPVSALLLLVGMLTICLPRGVCIMNSLTIDRHQTSCFLRRR